MIDLVLQRLGKEDLGVADALLLALAVERLHRYPFGARDLTPEARHRQAALVELVLANRLDDLGIDEHRELLVDLDDRESERHADLRRGQANARRGAHRF